MRRFLAVRGTACWVFVLVSLARVTGAQTWNDPRSITLVARAIELRRLKQLADTGLRDYQASAHGYVTFLAQLGEGFHTPPKIIKSDELESEVYWQAPNQSKQIIIGRRDTLLLPTDIAYHRDHLGIVQNNFPNIIRVGEGDEVRDVPHPLSTYGQTQYDFALADSFAIGTGTQRIRVYEVKIRPKNDTLARVVGAVYLDASEGQVVRMNLSFTHAAFLDPALEELSIVLENRLVGGRFWLPSRQEIEIRRTGTWLDYPIRAIISGRWEIRRLQAQSVAERGAFRRTGDRSGVATVAQELSVAWSCARFATARRSRSRERRHRAGAERSARARTRAGAGARPTDVDLRAQHCRHRAVRSRRGVVDWRGRGRSSLVTRIERRRSRTLAMVSTIIRVTDRARSRTRSRRDSVSVSLRCATTETWAMLLSDQRPSIASRRRNSVVTTQIRISYGRSVPDLTSARTSSGI